MRRKTPSVKGARQAAEGQKDSCGGLSREGDGSAGCYVTAAYLTARDLTDSEVRYEPSGTLVIVGPVVGEFGFSCPPKGCRPPRHKIRREVAPSREKLALEEGQGHRSEGSNAVVAREAAETG